MSHLSAHTIYWFHYFHISFIFFLLLEVKLSYDPVCPLLVDQSVDRLVGLSVSEKGFLATIGSLVTVKKFHVVEYMTLSNSDCVL